MRKPSPEQAMHRLLLQIREQIPLDLPEATICGGNCIGCPKKMQQFLQLEIDIAEQQLQQGEKPLLGDISRLANIAKKVHRCFKKNGLIR
jgi:hypothetical protein